MFNLTLALFVSLQAIAGVGGVAGGNVLFQKQSVYISPISRTLCHDRFNYRAVIQRCTQWSGKDQSNCVSSDEIEITQPIIGVQQICVGQDLGNCTKWKEIPFIQSPARKVDLVDSNSRVRGTSIVVVPSCF